MSSNRIQLIEIMLDEHPDDVFLLYALAIEYKSLGQIEKSIFYLDKVLTVNKGYVAAYYQKGELLAIIGKVDEALSVLEKGRKLALNQEDQKSAGEFFQLILSLED
ncbi:MAG: hypothetical protein ACK4K0_00420 [Flavobacteriales bacterium]